jgi:hypothetical protein
MNGARASASVDVKVGMGDPLLCEPNDFGVAFMDASPPRPYLATVS